MFFDQALLNLVLIAIGLGLSPLTVAIHRMIKACPGYSWSKRCVSRAL